MQQAESLMPQIARICFLVAGPGRRNTVMSSHPRAGIAVVAVLTAIGIAAAAHSAGRTSVQQRSTTGSASNTTPNATGSVSGYDTLRLTGAQESAVYLSLTQRKTKPSEPAGFTAAVGAVVPASIKLRPMPGSAVRQVPEVRAYTYAILPDQILIVDPVAKTIVDIIN